MHLLKIIRPTEGTRQRLQNSDFQSHFSVLKNNGIFLKVMMFKILYFLKMCPIFVGSLNNFDRSDGEGTISTRCTCGFMPNLPKKSWMVSIPHVINLPVKIKPALARSAGMGYLWVHDLKVSKREASDRNCCKSGVRLTVGTCLWEGLVVSTIVSSTPESFIFWASIGVSVSSWDSVRKTKTKSKYSYLFI